MNNFKKYLPTILGFVAVVGLLFMLRGPENAQPANNNTGASLTQEQLQPGQSGQLTADRMGWDFGQISMAAGKVTYPFKITNTSAQPIMIEKLYTSCMCTEARFELGDVKRGPFGMPGHGIVPKLSEEIPAGATATVSVTFDPAAHGPAGVGKIAREIVLEQSSAAPLVLAISADVRP